MSRGATDTIKILSDGQVAEQIQCLSLTTDLLSAHVHIKYSSMVNLFLFGLLRLRPW